MKIKLLEQYEIKELFRILSDKNINKNLCANPTTITESNLGGWLLTTEPGTTSCAYSIYSDNKLRGVITLNNISRIKNSAFVGVIAVESCTPKMVGVKAGRWIMKHCFETLNLNRIYGHTWADNKQMDAFYKRMGATLEGIEREHTWKQGQYVDMKIWSILRGEYHGN